MCHPFRSMAQPVRGAVVRLITQPPLAPREPLVLVDRPDDIYVPVERAIRRAQDGAR